MDSQSINDAEWDDADIDGLLERHNKAREAIVAETKGKRNVNGRITPCPACGKGFLGYAVHHNGHIHVRCDVGCIAWME